MPRQTKQLVAARATTYAARAIRAGATFEATEADARVLVAAGVATYATRDAVAAPVARPKHRPAPVPPPVDAAGDGMPTLRARFEALTGRKAHPFWRQSRLEAEVAALELAALEAGPAASPAAPETQSEDDAS